MSKKIKEKSKELTCKQCGHKWMTRPGRLAKAKRTLPAVCPKCISSEWAKGTSKRAAAPKRPVKKKATSAPVEQASE